MRSRASTASLAPLSSSSRTSSPTSPRPSPSALLTSASLDIPIFRVPIEPSETNGLRTRSFVMVDQTFSASTRRFGDVFGHLDDTEMLAVNRALALFLGVAN